MKKFISIAVLLVLTVVSSVNDVLAGPPLVNLEGVGGIAFNPVAYPADSDGKNDTLKIGDTDIVGKPRFGAWYVSLSDVDVDWFAAGVADTFFDRLEVSYGYESISQDNATTKHKNNIGGKLLLLPENSFDTNYVPAISVGTIWKHTSSAGVGVDEADYDFYAVATKLITETPLPVLLSGGALSTKGKTTGVFGYDDDRDLTWFGNADLILPYNFITGFEYKQGAHYSDWKDADYWDLHVAWTPTKNLSLVLAYVFAGDHKDAGEVGLGDGVVVSVQYAF
jgi:hypothetical protein